MPLIECPECKKQVSDAATACPNCGHPIKKAEPPLAVAVERTWSPGIAALLSLVIPGAGQMYKGQVLGGLVWLVAVAVGYACLIVPGIVLHILCILVAASGSGPSTQPAPSPSTSTPQQQGVDLEASRAHTKRLGYIAGGFIIVLIILAILVQTGVLEY